MAGIAAGGASNFGIHTDVVEAALDAEDFTPLVRVVFDAVASSLSTATTKQALLARAPQATPALDAILEEEALNEGGASAGRRASDRLKAMRKEAATPVISALERVVESRGAELSQICRGNAEEIVSSLQELDTMQQGTEELKARLQEGDVALRQTGSAFLNGLEQLQDLRRLQNSVGSSCKAVGATKQLLQLCAQAGRAVNASELYKAFRLLERAEQEFLGMLPDASQNGATETTGDRVSGTLIEGRLHGFLAARVREMQAALQVKAVKDFNEWLVNAREQAREIGMLALRKAAWERQREESQSQQRRRLAAELPNIGDPELAAGDLARPLSIRSAGNKKLNPCIHPSAAALLEGQVLNPLADVLDCLEMTQLHRCLQMHSCLGKMATFQEYYQVNRRLQLKNDLAAQGQFLAQYQNYLAQLVGFFVIEDRVGKSTEALSATQGDAGWETAVTYLKLAMETAFQTADAAATMLAIKDLVLLVCSALGQRGFHVAPLVDVLMTARPRYHELLNARVRPGVQAAVAESSGRSFEVCTAAEAADLSATLGLPLAAAGDPSGIGPTPPFTPPFSRLVPEILRIARRYVEESAAYAWGLVSPAEVLSIVRLQRDAMLLELPLAALETALSSLSYSDPAALDGALQSMADLTVLADSLQSLDDFTHTTVREVHAKDKGLRTASRSLSETLVIASAVTQPPTLSLASAGSMSDGSSATYKQPLPQVFSYSSGLTMKFGELQRKAEQQLKEVIAARLKTEFQRGPPLNWTPDKPVKTASNHSPYVFQLQTFLQETLARVAERLPRPSYERIGHVLMRLLGEMLLGMLLSEEVPAYNLYGLFRLNDDALALAEFASNMTIPGLEEELQEVIQFCDLMATGRLEEVLDGKKRASSYPNIDLRKLLILLRKYREVAVRSEHLHGIGLRKTKQPASFLKKKTAEKVAKQLRIYLEIVGAAYISN